MAVLTAQGIANVAVELLTREVVLPATVMTVPPEEFSGPNGATVTVRVRTPRAARTQGTPGGTITFDAQNEVSVDVTLSHLYDAIKLDDEAMTYEIERFAEQITAPQVASVATGAEDVVASAMNGLAADLSFADTATEADTEGKIQSARELLSDAFVPAGDRYLAVAPDITTRLLNVDNFVRADALGDGQSSALREAVMGKILGFTVVESPALDDGTAVAYHRSGFAWVNRIPVAPRGAQESATASAGGIGMRQVFDYLPESLSDASILSTFAGCTAVHEDDSSGVLSRSVKIDTASS